jgi:hypothetical protein
MLFCSSAREVFHMKRLVKKSVTYIIALCIVLSMCATAYASQANELKGHWAEKTLTEWVQLGLLKGDNNGNYNPDSKITRAEFMALVNRVMRYTAKSDSIRKFADVSTNKWYYDDASKALAAGYITGTSANTLSPEDTITREQAITIISRINGIDPNGDTGILLQIADSPVIAGWAKGPVAGAIREGLVTGSNGRINPKANTTRSEAIVLLDRVRTDTRVYYFAGTYGPESGTAAAGNVVIASPRIKLRNIIVAGDLEIADAVGEGEATLENVVVRGKIVAKGGSPKIVAGAIGGDGGSNGGDNGDGGRTPSGGGNGGSNDNGGNNSGGGGNDDGGGNEDDGNDGGGNDDDDDLPVLVSITIASPPSKLTYEIGEPLDLTGLVVTGTYPDNTTKTETVSMSNISGYDSGTAGEKTVTVTINGKTVTFRVNVITPEPPPKNTYYIRQGASGANNGTDWTNAWNDLPVSLERGATYYIAAGTYGPHIFKDTEVGSEVTAIKKATVEDHGTDIGWKAAYANGQALFTADTGPIFQFDSGYYTFDGQTGNGKSGHGIKIYNPNDGTGGGPGTALRATKTARCLTFEHIEIEGCNWREDTTPSTRLLFFTGDVSHLTLRYCYVHETSTQWMYSNNSSDILIEHCYFENCSRGMGLKIFGSSDNMNVIIRNNQFENVYNANNFIQLGEHHCAKSSGYEIYGNVFTMTDPLASCTIAIGNCSYSANDNVFIYNNTFVGLRGSGLSFDNANDTNIAANNLWVNCSGNTGLRNIKDQNNSRNVYKPYIFVNADKGDLRLAIPLIGSTVLGSAYSNDPDGKTRGEDGYWDYGAYEFRTDDRPHAFFNYSTITETLSGYEPFRVNVDGSGSIVPDGCSIISHVWDWGDGTTSSGSMAAHTFSAGSHTISLTVTDNLNRKDTRKLSVNVLPSEYPNLYLYLPLDGNLEDASDKGMKTSGTVIYDQGVIGQAVRFNQDTSRSFSVGHSNYLDGFENMTIAFWARKNSVQSNIPVVLKHTVYRIALTTSGVRASLWNAQGNSVSAEGKDIVADTQWHHYAVVYDGSAIKVYIDGVFRASAQFTGQIKRDATRAIVIGQNPWGDSFDGLMDEIRIYDRALTDDEILTLKKSAEQ